MRMRQEILYGERLVRCFADRPATIDESFCASVERRPEALAVAIGERVETYAALNDAVNRLAANLARAGLMPGDRVALLLGNQIEFVQCFLAAARLGLISVPMNTRQRQAEVSFVLNQCSATALVYAVEHADAVPRQDDMPTVQHLFKVGSGVGAGYPFDALLKPAEMPADWRRPASEDTLCLLYTSGTTGKPKGARLTHVSSIHSVLHYADAFELREGDTSILAVPISHVTGIIAILLTTLHVGGCMVMLPAFKARTFLELAAKWRVNFALLVPAMYNLMLLDPEFASFDLSSWRVTGFGGAPMPPATIEKLAQALPALALCNVYGSTETTSPATFLPIGDIARKPHSVGKMLPCVDIVVVDDVGQEVPAGQTGELLIGGPMVVPGYWNNPDGDRNGFVAGYWRSGDLGFIDEDGYVHILDRKKDMINRAGFKVYCVEVEATLAALPEVTEAAVVGVPDPVLGERVHAFIFTDGKQLTEAGVRSHCATLLSDYKVPDFVTLLSEPLPRNANGKVLKVQLRDRSIAARSVA